MITVLTLAASWQKKKTSISFLRSGQKMYGALLFTYWHVNLQLVRPTGCLFWCCSLTGPNFCTIILHDITCLLFYYIYFLLYDMYSLKLFCLLGFSKCRLVERSLWRGEVISTLREAVRALRRSSVWKNYSLPEMRVMGGLF